MRTCKVTIELESHLLTPMQSDTVFGHLCWAHRYRWGEEDLERTLLRDYDAEPHLVVSSAFPQGMLPRPCLPKPSTQDQLTLAASIGGATLAGKLDRIKRAGKVGFVPAEWLTKPWDELQALTLLVGRHPEEEQEQEKDEQIPHNTIDRATGTVAKEGGFYQKRALARAGSRWDIYLASDLDGYGPDGVREIFSLLGIQGFGQDKSTGAGRFKVLVVEAVELLSQGEAAMALSLFAPGPGLGQGFYSLQSKVGRLGGDWALARGWPFKYPLTLMAPGSVFMVERPAAFYGASVGQVHPHLQQVRQQSWMLPWLLSFTSQEKQRWLQ